ncbi:hypothetical protein FOZ61_008102 [Perkinsus olseni]|uniref:Immunoglobulin super DCC subclass member n=1 Tax=Perkinsus olseni TaxID=32597 RepID=A0A7J6M7K0_PEROL|nr:hypothetical protein FOZ61_008102 [Perkinsus olseni]KAF4674788.1 hypothetical protein FOL46_004047 [Perkinsus olseni]
MRYTILPFCLAAIAKIGLGLSACPAGDAQCQAEDPSSYCKFYMGDRVCQGSNTPCYCTTTPPPTPTPSGGPCPDGDAYCRQQTGDTGSYCKAAYQSGPGGGVCQGFDVPCTCSIPAPTVGPASTEQPAPTIGPASTGQPAPTIGPASTEQPAPTIGPASTDQPAPTIGPASTDQPPHTM